MSASYHISFIFGVLLFWCGQSTAKYSIASQRPLVDPCREFPFVQGPCYANLLRYSFVNGLCLPFYYGGCLGTRNNFETVVDCERQCLGRCEQTPGVTGPCYANFLRYTYVPSPINSCFPFRYGGCEGNDNNFVDPNDCFNACVNRRG